MKQPLIYAVLMLAMAITSCKKKDEDTNNNTTNPTPTPIANIVINSPAEGAMFALDSVVNILVDITADFEMHGYDVYVINETADDTVWTDGLHDHGEAFHIVGAWTNNVTEHSDMMIKVVAEIDHDGNTTEKSLHFHCHPE
ncbi:MAG: hypothetical protein K1X54_09585 [Flavobacteriales bacterium]|nr:hypothetical protein [Flavobacteriales bacterium]